MCREGWDAVAARRPVLEPDVAGSPVRVWPAFSRALADEQHDDAVTDRFSRRHVHQATGMVLAQVGVSPEDAELLLQGHAFATGTSMREVADDVLAGRLSFATRPTGIEESS